MLRFVKTVASTSFLLPDIFAHTSMIDGYFSPIKTRPCISEHNGDSSLVQATSISRLSQNKIFTPCLACTLKFNYCMCVLIQSPCFRNHYEQIFHLLFPTKMNFQGLCSSLSYLRSAGIWNVISRALETA